MAIRGNIGVSAQEIINPGDTHLVNITGSVERIAITAASLYNNSGAAVQVNLFESPDATTASGTKIDQISVPANGTISVGSLLGQGYSAAQNIVATAAAANVFFSYTRTEYDDGS